MTQIKMNVEEYRKFTQQKTGRRKGAAKVKSRDKAGEMGSGEVLVLITVEHEDEKGTSHTDHYVPQSLVFSFIPY